jgi:hypothetical protein
MVRQAIRQAHGPEQRRRTHHPELRRRVNSRFQYPMFKTFVRRRIAYSAPLAKRAVKFCNQATACFKYANAISANYVRTK